MKALNRHDRILIVFILVSAIFLYGSLEFFVRASTSGQKVAVVRYKNEEVMRLDLSINQNVSVKGTLGEVYIEVVDGKIRVEKETSPYHICSIQGWVEYANVPIVCLPNHIVILIENAQAQNDEDAVIQ
jgi:hypothetical protein